MIVPDDAVLMVLFCWVKPEIEFLFSSSAYASIGIYICLEDPVVFLFMTKQLDVNLIMGKRESICIWQLQIFLFVVSLEGYIYSHKNCVKHLT